MSFNIPSASSSAQRTMSTASPARSATTSHYPPGTLTNLLKHFGKARPAAMNKNGPEINNLIAALLTCQEASPGEKDLGAVVEDIMLQCASFPEASASRKHIDAVGTLIRYGVIQESTLQPLLRQKIDEQLNEYCKRLGVKKGPLPLHAQMLCLHALNRFLKKDAELMALDYLKHAMQFSARCGENLDEILTLCKFQPLNFPNPYTLVNEAVEGIASKVSNWNMEGQPESAGKRFANWTFRLLATYTVKDKKIVEDREVPLLHRIVDFNCASAVPILVNEGGAEIEAKDQAGNTPLAFAAFFGRTEAAKARIRAGADVNAKNKHGLSPYAMAIKNGNEEVAAILLKAGAKP